MRLRLEARAAPSRLAGWLSPVVAIAATLAVGFVLFAALGRSPLVAFEVFFVQPVATKYGVAELLLKAGMGAVVYVLAALIFDAAGARSALQQFASRRARSV